MRFVSIAVLSSRRPAFHEVAMLDPPQRPSTNMRGVPQFWTGLNEFLAAEYPSVPQIETRPNWTIRLSSGLRHVGFELRFSLRHNTVAIEIWFWRAASRPVWDRIRSAPAAYDALVGDTWKFEPVEGKERARMYIDRTVSDLRNDAAWSELYRWLGRNLAILYDQIASKLRQELDRADTSPVTT